MLNVKLSLFLLFQIFFLYSKNTIDTVQVKQTCLDIHNSWLVMNLDLTKNTTGYSAPVAARSFVYLSVGMYESVVELSSGSNSMSGQLSDYNRAIWKLKSTKLSFEHISNVVDYTLTSVFFENMPPSNKKKTEALFNKTMERYKQNYSKKELKNSEQFGIQLANEIIAWAKRDGADNAWNKNFPASYSPPICEACWTETLPGFVSALQPFWGENKLMIGSSKVLCDDIPYIEFSTDTTSKFYAENKIIEEMHHNLSIEKKDIARYWDDAPGITGTPIGHLFNIAHQISTYKKSNLEETLQLYVLLGSAVNDAVIESWKLKYKFNLIRPITYIQKYISEDFSTAIITPPFPEFPSGHSFQSGAGTEVFKYIYGDSLPFTDSTNNNRKDINGAPRKFSNFTEMSEEMSMSRFYGGIHYDNTLRVSLIYGRKIGKNTIQNLKFNK